MARTREEIMRKVEGPSPKEKFDKFTIGDVVDVHLKVKEGEKERIQVFTGLVIARAGRGASETFTVRRVVGDEGVERIFPYYSPAIDTVKVVRKGKVKRAKLYYMRSRMGKQARIEERRDEVAEMIAAATVQAPTQDTAVQGGAAGEEAKKTDKTESPEKPKA
jgi:large subunit ribosomal protein L19